MDPKPPHVVGMPELDAVQKIRDAGWRPRVTKRDGQPLIVTMDYALEPHDPKRRCGECGGSALADGSTLAGEPICGADLDDYYAEQGGYRTDRLNLEVVAGIVMTVRIG